MKVCHYFVLVLLFVSRPVVAMDFESKAPPVLAITAYTNEEIKAFKKKVEEVISFAQIQHPTLAVGVSKVQHLQRIVRAGLPGIAVKIDEAIGADMALLNIFAEAAEENPLLLQKDSSLIVEGHAFTSPYKYTYHDTLKNLRVLHSAVVAQMRLQRLYKLKKITEELRTGDWDAQKYGYLCSGLSVHTHQFGKVLLHLLDELPGDGVLERQYPGSATESKLYAKALQRAFVDSRKLLLDANATFFEDIKFCKDPRICVPTAIEQDREIKIMKAVQVFGYQMVLQDMEKIQCLNWGRSAYWSQEELGFVMGCIEGRRAENYNLDLGFRVLIRGLQDLASTDPDIQDIIGKGCPTGNLKVLIQNLEASYGVWKTYAPADYKRNMVLEKENLFRWMQKTYAPAPQVAAPKAEAPQSERTISPQPSPQMVEEEVFFSPQAEHLQHQARKAEKAAVAPDTKKFEDLKKLLAEAKSVHGDLSIDYLRQHWDSLRALAQSLQPLMYQGPDKKRWSDIATGLKGLGFKVEKAKNALNAWKISLADNMPDFFRHHVNQGFFYNQEAAVSVHALHGGDATCPLPRAYFHFLRSGFESVFGLSPQVMALLVT